ncbi:MAG TPA: hypothetical protein VGO67_18740 [Verrucomicrobiae bacterium]
MLYCNEQTGPLIGRQVLTYYNLECPQLLTVADMNRQNYFTVKGISLDAMSATKEAHTEVRSQISGHQRHAREIYGSIEHPRLASITRDSDILAAPEIAALGEFHNAETEQFKRDQESTNRTVGKIQRQRAQ